MSVLPARGLLVCLCAFSALNVLVALLPPSSAAIREPLALIVYIVTLVMLVLDGSGRRKTRPRRMVALLAAVTTACLPLLGSASVHVALLKPESWCVGAVASLAALLARGGWRVFAGVVWVPLVGVALVSGGVAALFSTGIVALLTAFLVGVFLVRMLVTAGVAGARVTASHQEELVRLAVADAYQRERSTRMAEAGVQAQPLLQRIIDTDGDLDAAERFACRVLEQTLRDEIRGRRLLNSNVREVVRSARLRGARVSLMDEGTLDDLDAVQREMILAQLAESICASNSTRLVARTGTAGSGTAVTLVASTPDETAAALCLDDEERVDQWISISRR